MPLSSSPHPKMCGDGGHRVPLEQRSGRLIADEEKVRRADYSYVNDGSRKKLEAFVSSVLDDLRARQ